MSNENKTLVTIFGHPYRIGSDCADAEYIQEAAAYLDTKMREAAAATGQRAPLEVAIQAAMGIADEVLSSRQRREALLDAADQRIDTFARRLESRADLSADTGADGSAPVGPPGD